MNKKIISLAILIAVLVMSVPQIVYAEDNNSKTATIKISFSIGKTYKSELGILSGTNMLFWQKEGELPDGITIKTSETSIWVEGKVSEKNIMSTNSKCGKIECKDEHGKEIFTLQFNTVPGDYSIIGVESSISKELGEPAFKLNPVARDMSEDTIAGGNYYYTSSDTSVATVEEDGIVTLVGTGTTVIQVRFDKKIDGESKYKENDKTKCTLTVMDTTLETNPSMPDSNQNQTTENNNYSSNNDKHSSNSKSKTVKNPNSFDIILQMLIARINNVQAGDTVVIASDGNLSLPLSLMKELAGRRDITVKMSYNYNGHHYDITIPSGQTFVLDDSIPWYGPLKLAAMFGADITPINK